MSTLRHAGTLLLASLLVLAGSVVSPAAAVAAPRPVVTTTGDSATVTWPAVAGADRYAVCLVRSLSQTSCTASTTTTRTSHTFRGLTPVAGTDYRVHVRAFDGSASAASPRLAVELKATTRPTAPVLTVTTTSDAATVAWKAVAGADRYAVCLVRSLAQTSCTEGFFTTRTSHTFTGLTPVDGTDYHVHVRAYVGSASAASPRTPVELQLRPDEPTGVKHTVRTDAATISWKPARYATSYDVCVMTSLAATACETTTARTTGTSATLSGLAPNPGADFVYVVRAYRGAARADSDRGRFDLPVGEVGWITFKGTTPTSLTLHWKAATNAEAYVVDVSTRADFASGVRTQKVTSLETTFADLAPGVRYHARVRGDNAPAKGPVRGVTTRILPTSDVDVRVVTYNLCGQDKCRSSSGIGSWSSRKSRAAAAALGTGATIISTQESGDKDTNFGSALPGFRRAAYQSAKSLFYKTSTYTLNRAGSLTLDADRKRYAVWAELVEKTSGTPFIVVDPHLEPYKGKVNDDRRHAQTRRMLALVDALNTRDLPVVYAGDMNSNKNNATYPGGYDGVRAAFLAAGHVDTLDRARAATNPDRADGHAYNVLFNSANQGRVTPIKNGDHVDAIYTSPEVVTRTWKVVVDLASPSRYRTPFASDHNPLTAYLTIPGRAQQP
jgi:endonuclease/exonuclease/phosphatase family metal-dependent hydrolase